jgi:hypothetical protein
MSTVTEVNPRLLALTEAGVSVWLGQIRRSLVKVAERRSAVVTRRRPTIPAKLPSHLQEPVAERARRQVG